MSKDRIEHAARALLPALVREDGGAVTAEAVDKALDGAVAILERLEAVVKKFDATGLSDVEWLGAFRLALGGPAAPEGSVGEG